MWMSDSAAEGKQSEETLSIPEDQTDRIYTKHAKVDEGCNPEEDRRLARCIYAKPTK